VAAEDLAQRLSGASDAEFEAWASQVGPARLLEAVFASAAAEAAPGLSGTLQWEIQAPDGLHPYLVSFRAGSASARRGQEAHPEARIAVSLAGWARLVTGQLPLAEGLVQGRLRLSGDLALARAALAWLAGLGPRPPGGLPA
jgi:putative sterol carrier protein